MKTLLLLLSLGVLHAAPALLTNDKGRSISVDIVSATETNVTVKRAGDGKGFVIDFATLDADSVAIVNKWTKERIKAQASLPTEKKSKAFRNSGWSFELEFKLPKYDYGYSEGSGSVDYRFDIEGSLNKGSMLIVSKFDKDLNSVEGIKFRLDENFAKAGRSLTPKGLKARGDLEMHKVESEKFNGFYIVERGSRIYHLTDGRVYIFIRFNSYVGMEGPINYGNIILMIDTMEVKSFRNKRK